MDRKQAKELLPIITAFANGEAVEFYSGFSECWVSGDNLSFDTGMNYRIKPKPTWRPWKPSECPKVFVVGVKSSPSAEGGYQVGMKSWDSVIILDGYQVSKQLRETGTYKYQEDHPVNHQTITLKTLFDQFVQILPNSSHQPCGILDTNPA